MLLLSQSSSALVVCAGTFKGEEIVHFDKQYISYLQWFLRPHNNSNRLVSEAA